MKTWRRELATFPLSGSLFEPMELTSMLRTIRSNRPHCAHLSDHHTAEIAPQQTQNTPILHRAKLLFTKLCGETRERLSSCSLGCTCCSVSGDVTSSVVDWTHYSSARADIKDKDGHIARDLARDREIKDLLPKPEGGLFCGPRDHSPLWLI